MSVPLSIFLIAQGCVFLVWAILAFKWLFSLRADAVARSGHTLPNMSTQLQVFRAGFTDPRYRQIRLALSVLTAILIALSGLSFLVVH